MVNPLLPLATVAPLLRRLRLSQLHMVRMAGQGANFRDMAQALHVTQPAMGPSAQELERVLGAPVFGRGCGRRATDGGVGLAVHTHARRALAALDQLEDDLPRYRDGCSSRLAHRFAVFHGGRRAGARRGAVDAAAPRHARAAA